jgi:predicted TIM-barrel fold metal-dependent hydrolase
MAEYELLSADSHLEVKPERWTHRIAEEYRDHAPHTVTLPDGGDGFVVDGMPPIPLSPLSTWAGRQEGSWKPTGMKLEGGAGAGSPEQRVEEMKMDGLDAEVLFCGERLLMLWRGISDDIAYKAVISGYNEWLAEEYCAVAPERLIGLGMIPASGVDDAIKELRHCADLGLKGVQLATLPSRQPHPTAEDDRFWETALELGMALTVHDKFNASMALAGPPFVYPRQDPDPVLQAKNEHRGPLEVMTKHGLKVCDGTSVWQLVLSGVFDRFPELQIFFAETRLGWIPFWLEEADLWYDRHLPWAQEFLGLMPLRQLPSEIVKDHCHWSVHMERFAARNLDAIGEDHVMFATDFPHVESEWPNSRPILEKIYESLPASTRDKVWAGNAVRFFGL